MIEVTYLLRGSVVDEILLGFCNLIILRMCNASHQILRFQTDKYQVNVNLSI